MPALRGLLLCTSALVACGRVGFDVRDDGGDGIGVDGETCTADLKLDPDNCGACGHGCLGAACTAGTCEVITLSTIPGGQRQVLVDATYVYVAAFDAVRRVPKTGGASEVLAMTTDAFRMIEHAGYLYWAGLDRISRTPIDQVGATEQVIDNPAIEITGVATDGTYVYWTTNVTNTRIYRTQISNSMRSDVSLAMANECHAIRRVGTTLYFIEETVGLHAIETDGTNPRFIAPVGRWEFEIDGGVAFIGDLGGTRVDSVTLATGAIDDLGPVASPWGLAFDAEYIYVANETATGTVTRVPRNGGATEVIADAPNVVGVAVDDEAVYWTLRDGGLYKRAK